MQAELALQTGRPYLLELHSDAAGATTGAALPPAAAWTLSYTVADAEAVRASGDGRRLQQASADVTALQVHNATQHSDMWSRQAPSPAGPPRSIRAVRRKDKLLLGPFVLTAPGRMTLLLQAPVAGATFVRRYQVRVVEVRCHARACASLPVQTNMRCRTSFRTVRDHVP